MDRKNEIEHLEEIDAQSKSNACFTFLIGRRRIGKTVLVRKFLSSKSGVYLFAARNHESVLCAQWQKELEVQLGLKIYGNVFTLADLFENLMFFSKQHHFVLIIDEFQDLQFVNPAFFSQMQNIWDSNKAESKINLIVCG